MLYYDVSTHPTQREKEEQNRRRDREKNQFCGATYQ
jgi:hypothetical protein